MNIAKEPEKVAMMIAKDTATVLWRVQKQLLAILSEIKESCDGGGDDEQSELKATLQTNLNELAAADTNLLHDGVSSGTGLLDKLSGLGGLIIGKLDKLVGDATWERNLEILDYLHHISDGYAVLHACAHGSDDMQLNSIAWQHLQRINAHIVAESDLVYKRVIVAVEAAQPVEPVVENALHEWRESWKVRDES
ncbi:MAG: hypothetical protein KDN22_14065 [Verrucomicrobiae bacterium]|nr:hypothetical protein [Verrucomicrobiae bacterium]